MPRRAASNGKVAHPDQAAQLRALKAIELRNAGHTLDEVAHLCGYGDRGACFHAIEREAGRMNDQRDREASAHAGDDPRSVDGGLPAAGAER